MGGKSKKQRDLETALWRASGEEEGEAYNYPEVKRLLKAGASPNIRDPYVTGGRAVSIYTAYSSLIRAPISHSRLHGAIEQSD